MPENKLTDHNATPLDDGSGLRGGTQGGGPPLIDPNHRPSSATEGSPAGPAARVPRTGPAAGDQTDATESIAPAAQHGSRHPSPSEVRTQGRDTAAVPPEVSRSGFNEGDPAVERKAGRSDGNMTDKSKHNPGEPGNAVHTT